MAEVDDPLLNEEIEGGCMVETLRYRSHSPQQTETAMEGSAKVATWLSHNVETNLQLHSFDMDKIEVLGDEEDDISMLTRTTSLGSKSISSLTSPGPGDDKPGASPGTNTSDNSRSKRGSSRKKSKKLSVTSLYSTVSSHDPYIQLMHHDSIDRRMSGESAEGRTRKISEGPGVLSTMMGARARKDSLLQFDDIEMDPMEEIKEAEDNTGKNVLLVPEHGNMQRQGVGRLSGRRAKYANLKKGGSSVFDDYAKAMRDRQRQARSEVTQDDTEEHNDKKDENAKNTKEQEKDEESSQVTEGGQTLGTVDTGNIANKCVDTTPATQEPTSLKPPKPPEARRSSWAAGSGELPPKPRQTPGVIKTGSMDREMEGTDKGSIGRFERGEKGRATWGPAEIKARSHQTAQKGDISAREQSDPSQSTRPSVARSNSVRSVRSSFQKVGDGLAKTFRQFKGTKQHKA